MFANKSWNGERKNEKKNGRWLTWKGSEITCWPYQILSCYQLPIIYMIIFLWIWFRLGFVSVHRKKPFFSFAYGKKKRKNRKLMVSSLWKEFYNDACVWCQVGILFFDTHKHKHTFCCYFTFQSSFHSSAKLINNPWQKWSSKTFASSFDENSNFSTSYKRDNWKLCSWTAEHENTWQL